MSLRYQMELHHQHFVGRGGRVRCEKWPESGVCESCLKCMLANQSEIEQRTILESMMKAGDPLLSLQAKKTVNGIDSSLLIKKRA